MEWWSPKNIDPSVLMTFNFIIIFDTGCEIMGHCMGVGAYKDGGADASPPREGTYGPLNQKFPR